MKSSLSLVNYHQLNDTCSEFLMRSLILRQNCWYIFRAFIQINFLFDCHVFGDSDSSSFWVLWFLWCFKATTSFFKEIEPCPRKQHVAPQRWCIRCREVKSVVTQFSILVSVPFDGSRIAQASTDHPYFSTVFVNWLVKLEIIQSNVFYGFCVTPCPLPIYWNPAYITEGCVDGWRGMLIVHLES